MLNQAQKYSICSMLAVSNLTQVELKLKQLHEPLRSEGLTFAREIDKHFTKRNGFVPKKVIQLLK